ncbi:MAG: hypothetical protein ACE5KZ_07160 [Candidatus Scalinduaceae bacterium]
MKGSLLTKFAIIPSLIIFMVSAQYFLQLRISYMRRDTTFDRSYLDPSETLPIILLGSFRGVLVDFLWIRGLARHDEKKFYELLAINNLIAKLQPHFPAVWIFQSWNMSYNIAHEWESPENKWKWVKAGLKFAEKGALKNPKSGELFFEIGHTYLHKFDSRSFKYADYYRERLMLEEGKDNYEQALFWVKKSLNYSSMFRSRLVMERTVCFILWRAALQAEKDGRMNDALEYVTKSISEWEDYLKRHPDDPDGKARSFLKVINEKKLEIEKQV